MHTHHIYTHTDTYSVGDVVEPYSNLSPQLSHYSPSCCTHQLTYDRLASRPLWEPIRQRDNETGLVRYHGSREVQG